MTERDETGTENEPRLHIWGGVELSEELLSELAREAEDGYDVSQLRSRPVKSPPPAAG